MRAAQPTNEPGLITNAHRDDFARQQIPAIGSEDFGAMVASRNGIRSILSFDDDRVMNATFSTTAGWPPETIRDPGYTPSRRHPIPGD